MGRYENEGHLGSVCQHPLYSAQNSAHAVYS